MRRKKHLTAPTVCPLLLTPFSRLISLHACSLQEEGPQEPQQETLQQIAARIIQKAWKQYVVGAAAVGTHARVHAQIKVNRHKLRLLFPSHTVVQRGLQVFQRPHHPLQPAGSTDDPQNCQSSRGNRNHAR